MSGLAGYSFHTPGELAATAAGDWIAELGRRDTAQPYGVALSGGRIAKSLYGEIAAQARAASLDWSHVHFFWADERCVPPEHPESNFRLAREGMFDPLGISPDQIHRVRGEEDCGAAAEEAEAEIRRVLPLDAAGQPVLDLIFLGIGEDGHVASLFPGEPPEQVDSARIYRHVVGPKPPPHRVTLGYSTIAAARQVWIMASGAGKANAYKQLIEREAGLPVVRVITGRKYSRLYEDISRNKV